MKLKAFADDTMNVAKMIIFAFDGVENMIRKGENATYQHSVFFLHCCQKPSLLGSIALFGKGLSLLKTLFEKQQIVTFYPFIDQFIHLSHIFTLSSIFTHLNTLKKKAFGKHCGKR